MEGVVRTRVGYAGGSTREPTYHNLGDHSETVEVDYDPTVLNYDDLVTTFLTSHNPTRPSYSIQYRSAIFFRTDEEERIARDAIARVTPLLGPVRTALEPLDVFWRAEDYHQKYRLRAERSIMAELRPMYTSDRAFVDSTAAARLNGWLDGYGDVGQLDRELPLTGLSASSQDLVRARVRPRAGARM